MGGALEDDALSFVVGIIAETEVNLDAISGGILSKKTIPMSEVPDAFPCPSPRPLPHLLPTPRSHP